jgi:phosphoribosylaminoimidazole-succinocarboxamide synthase
MVTTDRISAFDVVLPTGIPNKGAMLAQMSAFWFQKTAHLVTNHLVAMGYETDKLAKLNIPDAFKRLPADIARRSAVVRKAKRIDVECVARGYITGSAWADYKKSGAVFDMTMPKGMQESQPFPEPVFTPTTKAEVGHDESISFEQVAKMAGQKAADQLRDKTIEVYKFARDYALKKGIIIADTKFEFGYIGSELCLIDELLTPDSSRFWDVAGYTVGVSQPSYDKQIVRDWLTQSGWNKEPPSPTLPDDIVKRTSQRYQQAFERLTEQKLR